MTLNALAKLLVTCRWCKCVDTPHKPDSTETVKWCQDCGGCCGEPRKEGRAQILADPDDLFGRKRVIDGHEAGSMPFHLPPPGAR